MTVADHKPWLSAFSKPWTQAISERCQIFSRKIAPLIAAIYLNQPGAWQG